MRIHDWSNYNPIYRTRKRQVALGFILLALILLVGYAYVWQRVRTLELAKEHAAQKQLVESLTEKCELLRYEVEQLASMARIEMIARERLELMTSSEATLAGSHMKWKSHREPISERRNQTSPGSEESNSGGI